MASPDDASPAGNNPKAPVPPPDRVKEEITSLARNFQKEMRRATGYEAQNEDTKRQLRKKEENIILPVVKKAILQMNMSQHTTETMVEEFRKLLNSMAETGKEL